MFFVLVPSIVSFSPIYKSNVATLKNWWKEAWFGAILHLYDATLLALFITGLCKDFDLQGISNPILLCVHGGLRFIIFITPYLFVLHVVISARNLGLDVWKQMLDYDATKQSLQLEIGRWKMFYWSFSAISACFAMGFTFQSPNPIHAPWWLLSEQVQVFSMFGAIILLLMFGCTCFIATSIASCFPTSEENKPLIV